MDKAVITSFGQQDTTFVDYIKPSWPDIQLREVATATWGYGARNVVRPADSHYLTADWMRDNVTLVGPMGAAYRVWGDGRQMAEGDDEDYFGLSGYTSEQLTAMGYNVWTPPEAKGSWISEGDSSNFAQLIDNGLRSWRDPGWGGWGGRQIVDPADPKRWSNKGALDATTDGTTPDDYSSARFFAAIQNDFASRLKWSVTSDPTAANHHPKASVPEGLDLVRRPGDIVTLHGTVSHPDGNAVAVTWWQYQEAGTYPGTVKLSKTDGESTRLQIPHAADPGHTIHVILEATDDGTPALTHYQRVVITVAADTSS